MRRIFKCLLSGLVLKLTLFKKSASEIIFGLNSPFKPATSYLFDCTPFFWILNQNGTEWPLGIMFGNTRYTERFNFKEQKSACF